MLAPSHPPSLGRPLVLLPLVGVRGFRLLVWVWVLGVPPLWVWAVRSLRPLPLCLYPRLRPRPLRQQALKLWEPS